MSQNTLTARNLGSTFVAAFIGAALVSGKEVWQFFCIYGYGGIAGLILAVCLLGLFSYMLFTVARKSGITDMTRVLFSKDRPLFQLLIGCLQAVFMIGIYAVMLSGAGALTKQLFPAVPYSEIIGAALLLLSVTLTVFRGVGGMVRIFSFATPILVCATAVIAIWSLIRFGGNFSIPDPQPEAAPLHNNWAVSAINFMSYNFFCAIGLLAPLGKQAKSQSTIVGGTLFGSGMFFVLAAAIFVSMCTSHVVAADPLPMLTLAGMLSPVLQYVYAVLLLFGMYAAAVAVTMPLPDFIRNELHIRLPHKLLFVLLSVLALVCSVSGFGALIDYLYPMFGYLALAVLALLVIRFIQEKGHQR